MIYGVNNVRLCISKKRVPYHKADLIDENGRMFKDAVCYEGEFENKKNIDGYLDIKMYKGKESYIFRTSELPEVTEEEREVIVKESEETILQMATELTISMLNTVSGSNLNLDEQQNLYTKNVSMLLSQKRLVK